MVGSTTSVPIVQVLSCGAQWPSSPTPSALLLANPRKKDFGEFHANACGIFL
jgi:hypothetical protein